MVLVKTSSVYDAKKIQTIRDFRGNFSSNVMSLPGHFLRGYQAAKKSLTQQN